MHRCPTALLAAASHGDSSQCYLIPGTAGTGFAMQCVAEAIRLKLRVAMAKHVDDLKMAGKRERIIEIIKLLASACGKLET